jgi:hypothetical protein
LRCILHYKVTHGSITYRNIWWAPVVEAVIRKWFSPGKNFLDFGGGYGMFVRLMRDRGLSFYRQDIYCENLFAKHFDLDDNTDKEPYELVTAFEVFEHLVDPVESVEQMLSFGKSILFTTELQPNEHVTPDNWWYFLTDTGQHISLYSLNSLQWLAKKFNLNLYSNKRDLHLLTAKEINASLFKFLTQPRNADIFNKLHPYTLRTLLGDDFKKIASIEKKS